MARPREIQLNDGKVVLTGFNKEQADALEIHLSQFGKEQPKPLVVNNVTMIDPSDMPNKAIGLYFNSKEKTYELAIVNYNPITKQAKVDQIKNAGEWKNIAINNFKMEVVELGFI